MPVSFEWCWLNSGFSKHWFRTLTSVWSWDSCRARFSVSLREDPVLPDRSSWGRDRPPGSACFPGPFQSGPVTWTVLCTVSVWGSSWSDSFTLSRSLDLVLPGFLGAFGCLEALRIPEEEALVVFDSGFSLFGGLRPSGECKPELSSLCWPGVSS